MALLLDYTNRLPLRQHSAGGSLLDLLGLVGAMLLSRVYTPDPWAWEGGPWRACLLDLVRLGGGSLPGWAYACEGREAPIGPAYST